MAWLPVACRDPLGRVMLLPKKHIASLARPFLLAARRGAAIAASVRSEMAPRHGPGQSWYTRRRPDDIDAEGFRLDPRLRASSVSDFAETVGSSSFSVAP